MKRTSFTRKRLHSLLLGETERTKLAMFLVCQPDWVIRHGLSWRTIVEASLRNQGLELLCLNEVEPHPVYEVYLRVRRSGPVTKSGVEAAVRLAFGAAGRQVKRGHAYAKVRDNRAKVTVLVETL